MYESSRLKKKRGEEKLEGRNGIHMERVGIYGYLQVYPYTV